MYIHLDERRVANAAEAMDLPRLDDKNVTSAGFEFLSVDGPEAPAFPDELDFIVRMTMGPGTTPGERAEEKCGDVDVAVLGPDEVMRAALKRQVLLADTVHPTCAPLEGYRKAASRRPRNVSQPLAIAHCSLHFGEPKPLVRPLRDPIP